MDMVSFEETRLSSQQIGKGAKYLKEGMDVTVIFHNGKVLEVELPISITLKVARLTLELKVIQLVVALNQLF